MALSFVSYQVDGDTASFAVPFPYIAKTHVTVFVDGAEVAENLYTWLSKSQIKLDTTPQYNQRVVFRRNTPFDHRLVEFSSGYLLSEDLNLINQQLLYIFQEVVEQRWAGLIDGGYGVDLNDPTYAQEQALEIIENLVGEQLYQDFQDALDDVNANTQTIIDVSQKAGENEASITSEVAARADEDSALAGRIDIISAKAEGNEASITSEAVARADADGAAAARLDTVESKADGNASNITQEAATRADEDGALSSLLNTTKTTVDGHSTTIQQQQQSIDGIKGKWGVVVDSDGRITGVQLIGGPDKTSFEIVADDFAVYDPDTGVVEIGYVNGGFIINGKRIKPGSVTSDKISVEELSAISANLGMVTGGTFRTAESGYRVEISSAGNFPIWVGTGTKNADNAVFYVDKDGNAVFNGEISAQAVHVIKTENIVPKAITDTVYATTRASAAVTVDDWFPMLSLNTPSEWVEGYETYLAVGSVYKCDTDGHSAIDVRVSLDGTVVETTNIVDSDGRSQGTLSLDYPLSVGDGVHTIAVDIRMVTSGETYTDRSLGRRTLRLQTLKA